MRRALVLAVVSGVALLGSACAPIDEAEESGADGAAVEQTESTATPVSAPADQVASCVEMVKFGTYVGDAGWAQVWSDAGESDEGLQAACTEIGTTVYVPQVARSAATAPSICRTMRLA